MKLFSPTFWRQMKPVLAEVWVGFWNPWWFWIIRHGEQEREYRRLYIANLEACFGAEKVRLALKIEKITTIPLNELMAMPEHRFERYAKAIQDLENPPPDAASLTPP